MKRALLIIAAYGLVTLALGLALILAPPAHAAAVQDVTRAPVVQRDLQLAGAYWQTWPTCAVRVVVGPMTTALGNGGVSVAPADVWAETVDGSCLITLSRSLWSVRRAQPRAFCTVIAHEYGHVLGYPDSAFQPLMNFDLTQNHDPLCKETR